ncbi:unnamed protein product [Hydatigera taeniaeformis]|uniref:Shugoshin_C domain-containing protein n=1 Tax=Hydatigena taeniaeformis TaxID=6205 RepID=A0A0R3WPF4_HYDTA|nr:unnamed protein product [Hydatigera taeniaeformis]
MPSPQTPPVSSGKRQNRAPKRNLTSKRTLNISRKILEKSVIQQNKRIESVQQNNIQLARRVSELQKELSDRTAELQFSREEIFQLRLKLNRLENNSAESALHALCEKLASVMEEIYRAHEFATRVCSEIAAPQASPSPEGISSSRKSIDSIQMECTNAAIPGAGEDVRSPIDTAFRASAQSVEMELDSFDPAVTSVSCLCIIVKFLESLSFCGFGYSSGRKTMVPPLNSEEVVLGTPPTLLHTGMSSPAKIFQTRRSASPILRHSERSSSPTQSISSCPAEDEACVSTAKPKRKRGPAVKKSKETFICADTGAVAESAMSAPSEVVDSLVLPSDLQPTGSHPSPTSSLPTTCSNQPEAGLEKEKKSGGKAEKMEPPEPGSLPRSQSKRRRKRLRLIADDSVFIPISDSMMEDAVTGNKENIAKTSKLVKSEPKNGNDDGILHVAYSNASKVRLCFLCGQAQYVTLFFSTNAASFCFCFYFSICTHAHCGKAIATGADIESPNTSTPPSPPPPPPPPPPSAAAATAAVLSGWVYIR